MDFVEIPLMQYKLRFKQLNWREEFRIKIPEKGDGVRILLSHALHDVAGIIVSTEEARRVIDTLPPAIIERIFKVYRGSRPLSRKFVTANLYRAPETDIFQRRLQQEQSKLEQDVLDPAMASIEQKFGSEQLAEARELNKKILAASGLRGAVKATDHNV
jgi:hypothetical protein